ncbi:hypothetical protein VTL71DRAFT_4319 [Oculimacula yallundae]|uniref:Uncharacterized protein n=1 Tax=Oculimacula yallundae TaxID=86028 RepID=A0ABR4C5F4_9HELO
MVLDVPTVKVVSFVPGVVSLVLYRWEDSYTFFGGLLFPRQTLMAQYTQIDSRPVPRYLSRCLWSSLPDLVDINPWKSFRTAFKAVFRNSQAAQNPRSDNPGHFRREVIQNHLLDLKVSSVVDSSL